jgi:hypothetical protein
MTEVLSENREARNSLPRYGQKNLADRLGIFDNRKKCFKINVDKDTDSLTQAPLQMPSQNSYGKFQRN